MMLGLLHLGIFNINFQNYLKLLEYFEPTYNKRKYLVYNITKLQCNVCAQVLTFK